MVISFFLMKSHFLLALLICSMLLLGVSGTNSTCRCFRRSENREELVLSARMHEILDLTALPQSLDWRNKDGVNFVTMTRNQHIPHYCGACYAFASTSALSDRIRIARGPVGPEVNLAVQVLLSCDSFDLGCSGGDGITAYKFIKDFGGLPSETCQPYEAEGRDTGKKCTAMDICRSCDSKGCFAELEHEAYGLDEYGMVSGELHMMAELQRGPIACAIATPEDFCNFVGDGIYQDLVGKAKIDHLISVVGYGEENGQKYWVIRNSWGTYWGNYGFAKVARGINNIHIESDCAWATPSNAGRPVLRRVSESQLLARRQDNGPWAPREYVPIAAVDAADAPACRAHRNDWNKVGGELVRSPRPHEILKPSDLPTRWDWRNVAGLNYVTPNTNEHNPKYCASCWAQAVTSALSDRLAVKSKGAWPKVSLSPQMLINCNAGGSCSGGDPAGAYAYMHTEGVVDATCQGYRGEKRQCDKQGVCENCAPNGEHGLVWPGTCTGVESPKRYFVSEFGSVTGPFNMKAEIYQRGPIGCGLQSTRGFRSYKGGIYSEKVSVERLNHEVSIAGWGVSGAEAKEVSLGTEFWIGRNSWGVFWGEDGWFRIKMHDHNLGVESDCDWGVPEETEDMAFDGEKLISTLGHEAEEMFNQRTRSSNWLLFGSLAFAMIISVVMCASWQRGRQVRNVEARHTDEEASSTPYIMIA
eukprot:TRINITY_DN63731_c0_g1_i1.p1 TRINITY_DN63731_c0_g1~~TRINITY_DN63731_c0_g1_i1.p1  ORF type:complete len:699 (-),score=103.00 TRINITY_DN63731_c0_g1_i1:175-2271(-)